MMRKLMVVGFLILGLLVAGCAKAPAEAALKAADEAIAKAKPEAEKYVPEQFALLNNAAADAKAKFDAGDYKGCMEAAKDIPMKANDAMTAAAAKKDELTKQWNEMLSSLPPMVQGLSDKIGALAAMKKLPKGFDAAQLETAKTSLAGITSEWTAASEAFKGGDIMGAVAKGGDVKTKAGDLAKMLEAAAAPAPATTPAKK